MRPFLSTLLMISLACACFAQGAKGRWKVLVIVPERHLSMAIPDPAVETEINRQLIDAGYKVIDPQRVREILTAEVQDRLMRKDKNAEVEAKRLARRVGADVVVTGEAFTTVALRKQVKTDLGTVDQIYCSARVELKAFKSDTGALIFADAITKTGSPEMSEPLSSKTALQDAAEEICPRILAKLDKLADSPNATMAVQVRNVSYSEGSNIREVLRKTASAVEISEGEFDSGVWGFDITVPRSVLPRLTVNFEQSDRLKKLKLVIQRANKTEIVLNRKG